MGKCNDFDKFGKEVDVVAQSGFAGSHQEVGGANHLLKTSLKHFKQYYEGTFFRNLLCHKLNNDYDVTFGCRFWILCNDLLLLIIKILI